MNLRAAFMVFALVRCALPMIELRIGVGVDFDYEAETINGLLVAYRVLVIDVMPALTWEYLP